MRRLVEEPDKVETLYRWLLMILGSTTGRSLEPTSRTHMYLCTHSMPEFAEMADVVMKVCINQNTQANFGTTHAPRVGDFHGRQPHRRHPLTRLQTLLYPRSSSNCPTEGLSGWMRTS